MRERDEGWEMKDEKLGIKKDKKTEESWGTWDERREMKRMKDGKKKKSVLKSI